jgi:hypothetical protein
MEGLMAKISDAEMERVISAAQNRRVLDFRNRIHPKSPEVLANERKLGERIRAFFTKAGIEVEELDKMLSENQSERRRLLEREKAAAQKLLPRIEDTFRHGIHERLKALELANLPNINPPTFIVLDTPFQIRATPHNILTTSHIFPQHSTAQIQYLRDQDGTEDVIVSFFFQWENSSPNSVLLANVDSHLVVEGLWEINARSASFVPMSASVFAGVELRLFELWNFPPTSPLYENSQTNYFLDLDVDGGIVWLGAGKGQDLYEWVFNSYDVKKYSSFMVPPKGVVVFEVKLYSGVHIIGDGCFVSIQIAGHDAFLLCPFVKLEVSEVVQKGPPL